MSFFIVKEGVLVLFYFWVKRILDHAFVFVFVYIQMENPTNANMSIMIPIRSVELMVQGSIKWENVCWLSKQAPIDRYEHHQEGISLVIKAREISFFTTNNVHSTHINANDQVVMELVNPNTMDYLEITL